MIPDDDATRADGFVDENPVFTKEEEAIAASVAKSKGWKLLRDALGLERERLYRRGFDPESRNLPYLIGKRDGAIETVNRLLREGPYLAVYYDRYVRERARTGSDASTPPSVPRPGEPPVVGE